MLLEVLRAVAAETSDGFLDLPDLIKPIARRKAIELSVTAAVCPLAADCTLSVDFPRAAGTCVLDNP